MPKTYILDTNILLHDPNSILQFADNCVLLPIEVIIEIDRFKHEISSRGQNAREVSRLLDQLRRGQSLARGVQLPGGGILRVHCADEHDAVTKNAYADSQILRIAREIQDSQPDARVVIVTKDINLRIRADAVGLTAEDYTSDRVGLSDLYSGRIELSIAPGYIDTFVNEGASPLPAGAGIYPNEYVLLKSNNGCATSALARVDHRCERLVRLHDAQKPVCGIQPKNKEQHFLLDALLCDEIKLVTITGKAGTGKTLFALAAGLYQVLIRKSYRGLLVTRPTTPVGRSMGALPGGIDEKLAPWLKPISDTLEALLGGADLQTQEAERIESSNGRSDGAHSTISKHPAAAGSRKHRRSHSKAVNSARPAWTGGKRVDLASLIASGAVDVEPLSYIRGRSIPRHFLIVDEAQNLTPLEVKTIITRVGHGTKVVLTGDPQQIDNPYVDSSSNGLTCLVHRFRDQPIAAHVELVKGERSQLAELAANLL